MYQPLWDDLPALYAQNGSGSSPSWKFTNKGDCDDRAATRMDDFFRLYNATGGQRLYQRYSGLLPMIPGSTLKATIWAGNGQGVYTEILRDPFLWVRFDPAGENGIRLETLPDPIGTVVPPSYPEVGDPVIKIVHGIPTPKGNYDSVRLYPDGKGGWVIGEKVWAGCLQGAPSLADNAMVKATIKGWMKETMTTTTTTSTTTTSPP
jgi:hypothetical protein